MALTWEDFPEADGPSTTAPVAPRSPTPAVPRVAAAAAPVTRGLPAGGSIVGLMSRGRIATPPPAPAPLAPSWDDFALAGDDVTTVTSPLPVPLPASAAVAPAPASPMLRGRAATPTTPAPTPAAATATAPPVAPVAPASSPAPVATPAGGALRWDSFPAVDDNAGGAATPATGAAGADAGWDAFPLADDQAGAAAEDPHAAYDRAVGEYLRDPVAARRAMMTRTVTDVRDFAQPIYPVGGYGPPEIRHTPIVTTRQAGLPPTAESPLNAPARAASRAAGGDLAPLLHAAVTQAMAEPPAYGEGPVGDFLPFEAAELPANFRKAAAENVAALSDERNTSLTLPHPWIYPLPDGRYAVTRRAAREQYLGWFADRRPLRGEAEGVGAEAQAAQSRQQVEDDRRQPYPGGLRKALTPEELAQADAAKARLLERPRPENTLAEDLLNLPGAIGGRAKRAAAGLLGMLSHGGGLAPMSGAMVGGRIEPTVAGAGEGTPVRAAGEALGGSAAGTLARNPVDNPVVGAAAGVPDVAGAFAAGAAGGPTGLGLYGAAMSGGNAYQSSFDDVYRAARERGMNHADAKAVAHRQALGPAAVSAVTGAIVNQLRLPIDDPAAGLIENAVRHAMSGGGIGAAQSTVDQVAQHVGYGRPIDVEGIVNAGIENAVLSAGTHVVAHGAERVAAAVRRGGSAAAAGEATPPTSTPAAGDARRAIADEEAQLDRLDPQLTDAARAERAARDRRGQSLAAEGQRRQARPSIEAEESQLDRLDPQLTEHARELQARRGGGAAGTATDEASPARSPATISDRLQVGPADARATEEAERVAALDQERGELAGEDAEAARRARALAYSPEELGRMPGRRMRDVADALGVTFDAPSTTLPRILDAQERTRLQGMSSKELWDAVRARGLRAGSRAQNIDALVGASRRPAGELNTSNKSNGSAAPSAAPAGGDELEARPTVDLRVMARDRGLDPRLPREQLLASLRRPTEATGGAEQGSETAAQPDAGETPSRVTQWPPASPGSGTAAPAEGESPLAKLGGKRSTFTSGDRTFTVDYLPDPNDPRAAFVTGLASKGTGGKFADVARDLAAQLKGEGFRDVTYRPDGEDGRDAARRRLFERIREQVRQHQQPERGTTPETPEAAGGRGGGGGGAAVTGFTTEQGSTYDVRGETTRRTKTPHALHDAGDVGVKPRSARTVYVSGEDATRAGMWGSSSATGKRAYVAGDRVVLTSENAKTGRRGADERLAFTTRPEVGRHPLELWGPAADEHGEYFKASHPGSRIVELAQAGPTPHPTRGTTRAEVAGGESETEPAAGAVERRGASGFRGDGGGAEGGDAEGRGGGLAVEPIGEGGRFVIVRTPKDARSVFGKDGLGGSYDARRGGYVFPAKRGAEVRGAVDQVNRATAGGAARPQTVPGDTVSPDEASARAAKPARETGPRPPKGFTRAELERRLMEHYEQAGAADADATAGQQDEDATQATGGAATTFARDPGTPHGFPAELADRFTPEEFRRLRQQRVLRLAGPGEVAGGEDAMSEVGGMGIDRYERMLRSSLDAGQAGRLRRAVDAAHESPDPAARFLAQVHEALTSSPPGERRPFESKTPEQLPPGTRFEFQGEPFRVVEDEHGVRILEDHGSYPEVPLDFLERVPVDKGTLETPAAGRAAEKPRPAFYDPEATGDRRPGQSGIFGQTVVDAQGAGETPSMFHQPVEVRPAGGETARDARIRAKYSEGERATGTMFGDQGEGGRENAGGSVAGGDGGGGDHPAAAAEPPRTRYELERMPLEELRRRAAELDADPMAQEGRTERTRLVEGILEGQAKQPRAKTIAGGAPAPEARAFSADDFEGAAKEPGSVLGSAVETVRAAAYHLRDSAMRYSGKMFPTLTRLARGSGEAAARYVASRAYATEAAPVVAEDVIGPPPAKGGGSERSLAARLFGPRIDPELDKLVGAVLVEDNLASIRAGHEVRARDAQAQADAKTAEAERLRADYAQMKAEGIKGVGRAKAAVARVKGAKAAEAEAARARREAAVARHAAGKVGTIINAEGSPLTTITEPGKVSMPAALKDPRVAAAVARYKAWFAGEPESNYKAAQEIAADADLPTRGEKTGARVNLIAVDPESPTEGTVYAGSPGGNPANSLKKSSPFARRATGAAQGYEIRASKMIENTLARGTEIANQRRFYDQLVADGVARYGEPGEPAPTIDGKPTHALDVQRRTLVSDGRTVPQNQKLWIRRDGYREVRRAVNVDAPPHLPLIRSLASAANKSALISAGEALAHWGNQLSAVVRTPGVSFPGIIKRGWNLMTNDPGTRAQLKDLARMGALQAEGDLSTGGASKFNPLTYTSRLIKFTDRLARLVVDDAYSKLAAKGLVKDTETNRRDLVNQLGQYNKRAQDAVVDLARSTGMGPFATAGSNFYAQGLKNLVASPGVTAASWPAAFELRARVMARFAAALGGVALANYLKWGRVDGGNSVPVGAVRLDDDKDGRVRYYDVLSLLNITRGLRATGLRAVAEGIRRGDRPAEIADAAVNDARAAAVAPIAGPLVNTAWTAFTGHDAAGFQLAKKAAPGESQIAENVKAAGRHFNPLVNVGFEAKSFAPGDLAEAGRKQLGKFAVKVGRPEESVATIQARKMLAGQGEGAAAGRTPDEQAKHDARRALVARLRTVNADAGKALVERAVRDGTLPASEAREVRREASRTDLQNMVNRLQRPGDALRVYDLATAAEREQLAPVLRDKVLRSELPHDEQDRLLAGAGIAPPVDLAVTRELHALNARATGAAEAKREGESLARQRAAALVAGDDARAEALRGRAIDRLRASQLPEDVATRRRVLETVHRAIEQVRERADEGTVDRAEAERLIRRLVVAAKLKPAA